MKTSFPVLLISCLALPFQAFAAGASSLTVGEGFYNPTGFHDSNPTFSWKLPAGVKKQTAYRLELSSEGKTTDTGWITSDQSTFVPSPHEPFHSRQQVAWRVNFRDEAEKEAGWSEPARFELGLLSSADWKAKWIRPQQQADPAKEPVAQVRRSFPISKKIEKARLYATARGLFDLTLNGQRVGKDHFANGFTSYNKHIDTLTYDVTSQLQTGNNTIGGMIGTGWYAGRFPFGTKKVGPYGNDTALLVQLEITYQDGTTEIIVSDETWEGSFNGPIISSSIYDGEIYDARRQPTDWSPVQANPDLGKAALTPKAFAPVREIKTLAVKKITKPQPGRYVFDLGQNMVGWARIKIPVEKDQTITIRFAEMLNQDGTLYTENYRSAKSTDTYTAAATGIIEWEPTFTFHGFRYVELSGLPANATPQKDWITGIVLSSDLPALGKFTSSHEKLNQLQQNIIWGWRGNSLDIPTDCPQRDERAGWTGDSQVFCATAMFNTDSHAFWKSWLRSLRDDQDPDGVIPDIVPAANQKFRQRSPGWLDTATFIPWDVYVRTGDTGMLSENYVMMEKLVGWYRAQSENHLLPNIKGFGDWLQPYPNARATKEDKMGDRRGDTPLPLLGAAYYARSSQILADSARILNRTDDAKRYAEEAANVKKAFAAHYFDADGKIQNGPETQTAYAIAIVFDLISPELKTKAGNHLARLVAEADGHLRTGFLGTSYLAPALDQTGHADVAFGILFKETYPSWFYSINQGATTMWERWNSYSHDKGFGDVSMNSFNHYAYGAIGQWMYERIAGLAPDPAQPGYKHFLIRPQIGGPLDSARAEYETPYGTAASSWKRKDEKLSWYIIVPPNTSATLEFPNGRKSEKVTAGTYHYDLEIKSAN
ncbi:MAG: family 78 glycoside hydrolase catalytic domain [Luteolibacter sp.]